MADPVAFDVHQVTDLFATASAHRFTGQMLFDWKDGEPKQVQLFWRLSFGDQLRRFIRILRGRPPPGAQ